MALDPHDLDEVIFACVRTKLEVVAADERDAGRRQVLNLGHTVGHAIEAASGYRRYRHGEAVGLGLLAALRLSEAGELRDEVEAMLAAPAGCRPSSTPRSTSTPCSRRSSATRSATAEGVGFVLIERPGEPLVGQRLDADRVRAAVEELESG